MTAREYSSVDILTFLERNYDRHLTMLRFVEAKSAALMTAISAALLFLLSNLSPDSGPALWFPVLIAVCGFVPAFIILAVSLIPLTDAPQFFEPKTTKFTVENGAVSQRSRTILFFGDTQYLASQDILNRIEETTGKELSSDSLEAELADQICIVARIAQSKSTFFTWAAWLVIAGLTTPIGAAIVAFVVVTRGRRFARSGDVD